MSPDRSPDPLFELQELLDALAAERLTDSQHARLEELLRGSPEARRAYCDFIDLHLGLRRILGTEVEVNPAADVAAALAGPLPQVGREPSVSRNAARLGRRTWIIGGSFAALLLAGVWVGTTLQRGVATVRPGTGNLAGTDNRPATAAGTGTVAAPEPTSEGNAAPGAANDRLMVGRFIANAWLARTAGAVLFGELTPPVGSNLQRGHEYALIEGQVEIAFSCGATAIVTAPAAFVWVSAMRLDLRVGKCSVHAPDGAEGFEVTTPQTRVVDLGTRFSVRVHESGDSDVQVVEGLAEVHEAERPEAAAARLATGEARRYSLREPDRSRQIGFDKQAYESGLPDRVISYTASKTVDGRVENLESVKVQRRGIEREYRVEELIPVDIIHFASSVSASNLAVAGNFKGTTEAALRRDNALNTGLINPGMSREPLTSDPVFPDPRRAATPADGAANGDAATPAPVPTQGMAFRFDRPVVNSAGPDVVLFEIQSAVYPPPGDAFHISPLQFAPGLRSHTIRRFDITMASAEAQPVALFAVGSMAKTSSNLDELRRQKILTSRQTMQFRALAVGIDLSDLGYPAGASVEGLFLQDAGDDKHYVDPVWIGGLPAERD